MVLLFFPDKSNHIHTMMSMNETVTIEFEGEMEVRKTAHLAFVLHILCIWV